ncbi:MAG: hypothetical protein AAGI30_02215 [Planctomycetota bacterium]
MSRLLFAIAAVAMVLGASGLVFALMGLVAPNAGWIGGAFGLAVVFAVCGLVTIPRPPDEPEHQDEPGTTLAPPRGDGR